MKKDNLKARSKKILSKKKPEKSLLLPLKKSGGRSSSGRITIRHKGSGVKRRYRIIDFGQKKIDVVAKVEAIEYDPNRTAFIMLLEDSDGEKRYCLAPHNIKVEDEIICSEKAELKLGNRMKLKNIPVGTQIYNVELERDNGGSMARSAGSSIKVLAHEDKYCHLEMPSSERRKVSDECFASIGQVSFPEHRFINVGKAGTARRKGKRPSVRGTAMNPCDHPHGGGEGRAGIGMKYPKTPWGKHALGVKTRKNKWTDKNILRRRKNKKKK